MKRFICIAIIVSFMLTLQMDLVWAQRSDASRTASPAYYFSGDLRKSEQLKIEVQIWGHVKSPGLYIVPDDIDLLSLISLAGGPTHDAKLDNVKLVRVNPDTVISVDVKRFTDTANQQLIPVLRPHDTVIVSGSAFYSFSRIVRFISQVAAIATAYIVISDAASSSE